MPTSAITTAGRDVGRGIRLEHLELILKDLRVRGAASRAALGRRIGLTRPTMTRLVGELIALGLVREAGRQVVGQGRPGTALELDGRHVFAIGAEINVDALTVIVHDLSGRERSRRRESLDARRKGPLVSIERLAALSRQAVAEAAEGTAAPLIAGFATGVPGLVDPRRGLLLNAPNLRWSDVPLAQLLSDALGSKEIPLVIGNDANFAVLAEYWRGEYAGRRNLVYVTGDVGIGGGVLIEGALLLGSGGKAAEVGHLTVQPNGPACGCGRLGCWEALVGFDAFLRSLAMPPSDKRPEALAKHIAVRAREKEPAVLGALESLGERVGIGVANLVNVFDPDAVILGGYFTHLAQWILPAAHKVLARQLLAGGAPVDKLLVTSSLGFRAAALGAALHAAEAVFSNPTLFAPTAALSAAN